MRSQFGIEIERLILAKYKSLRAFMRESEGPEDEDTGVSHLSKVIRGETPPMLSRVEGWLDTLGVSGLPRQRLMDLAAIAILPDSAQPRFVALVEMVERQREEIHALHRKVAEVEHRYDPDGGRR